VKRTRTTSLNEELSEFNEYSGVNKIVCNFHLKAI
jgi:hypothetical protein